MFYLSTYLEANRLTFLARYTGSFFALRAAVEPIAALDKPEPLIIYLPGLERDMKESVGRAFSHLLSNKTAFGVAREVDTSNFHVEVIDLLGNKVQAEVGVAFFVATFSALRKAPPQAALLVLGDMSIQGNIKPVRSLVEPLQVAMDNGAKRALIPIENKRQFLEVNPDVLERVDPIFFGDLRQAAFKSLGLN